MFDKQAEEAMQKKGTECPSYDVGLTCEMLKETRFSLWRHINTFNASNVLQEKQE